MSSVTADDVVYMHSAVTSYEDTNGGGIGDKEVVNLSHNTFFKFVSQETRKNGATFRSKVFWLQKNADDSEAYEVSIVPLLPTPAGDRLYYQRGTMTDTQADIKAATNQYAKVGVGKLQADISAGATSLVVTMEADDYQFDPASFIYISSAFYTGQTMELGDNGQPKARVGDSVLWSTTNSRWERLATRIVDHTYPNGKYIGDHTVMTSKTDTKSDFVRLKENKFTNTIGTGDGTNTTRALTALTNITNGLVLTKGYAPTVTATCSGIARTVTIKPDGSCTGYCSAGQLNVATGAWTTPITWTTPPDNSKNITIVYYDKNYVYSGNNVTLYLASDAVVAYSYSASSTYVSGLITAPDSIKASASSVSVNSTGGGYNSTTYPIYAYNGGTLKADTITITFTGSTSFTASGAIIGELGSGNISIDFSPVNPKYGVPWFTMLKNGLTGTFVTGDTLVFTISPAVLPFWITEVIPPNTGATPVNLIYFTSFFA